MSRPRRDHRHTRLAVEPLENRRLLAVSSFQDGVLPTPDYDGARDATIFAADADVNFGDDVILRADAEQSSTGQPAWTLIKWDLSSIPAGATVDEVTLTVNITNTSVPPGFHLFEVKTPWLESEVTWKSPTTDNTWEDPGLTNPIDAGDVILGTLPGTALGPLTIALTVEGLDLVQRWVNDPATNHGFLLSNADNTNSVRFDSREGTTPADRPKLSIDFDFVDTDLPTAALTFPADGGPADQDDDPGEVRVGLRDRIEIQLSDFALDDATVTAETVVLTKSGQPVPDVAFSFDAATDLITLTPTAAPFPAGDYVIILNDGPAKIADTAGNQLPRTVFSIQFDNTLPTNPIARDDSYEIDEDTPLIVNTENGVLANDDDGNDPQLVATLVRAPDHGTIDLNGNGSFTFTPETDYFGPDVFIYRISTPLFDSPPASVVLDVRGVADAPIAMDDSFTVLVDGQLDVDAPGVLTNDEDRDGDKLTAVLLTPPENGNLTLSADGSFQYTPNPLFVGVDRFSYAAADALTQTPATVLISVHPFSSIAGTVWNDLNRDGSLDASEPGQAGWTVFLDTNQNGRLDAGESRVQTDAEGDYKFPDLPPGIYSVSAEFRQDWQRTYPALSGGELTFVQEVLNGSEGTAGQNQARGMTISPDGRNIYVSSLTENSVSVYDRDAVTGEVTLVEVHIDGVNGVDGLRYGINVKVSPDGRHVYATGRNDDAIAHFDRDVNTGRLTYVGNVRNGVAGVTGLAGAAGLAISADGRHVYAASRDDNAVAVFSRDVETGALTFVHSLLNAVDGASGPAAANHVTVSPDGGSVYLAGPSTDAVTVFSRDAESGRLTFVESLRDGVGGVDGLDGVYHLVVSSDSKQVYVASRNDNALATFSRDVNTGRLTPLQLFVDGVDGIGGLIGATEVAFSADGQNVYVVSVFGSSMVVFDRSVDTGELSAVQTLRESVDGVGGLNRPYTVIVSPDGDNVYTGTLSGHSIAVFDRDFQLNFHLVEIGFGEEKSAADFGYYAPAALVAFDDRYEMVEGNPLIVDVADGVLSNDLNVSVARVAILVEPSQHGFVILGDDGTFQFTPAAGFTGTTTFQYRFADGEVTSNTATVTIDVIPFVNSPPLALDDSYSVDENGTLVVDVTNGVLANDEDADGHALAAVKITGPANGSLVFSISGSFSYSPRRGFTGIDSFTYRASDGFAASELATVTIEVIDAIVEPIAADDSYVVGIGRVLEVGAAGVLFNDVDPDDDLMWASLIQRPKHGELSLGADGSFVYTPDPGFVGTDGFIYRVEDEDVGPPDYEFVSLGRFGSQYDNMAALNGNLLFTKEGELWISDGTAAGTRLLIDLNPGPVDGAFLNDYAVFNDELFFAGYTETTEK